MALSVIRILAISWIAASIALYLAQGIIMFPAPQALAGDPERAGALPFQTESLITADGIHLLFWAAPPKPGMPTIIDFHGNGSAAQDGARYLKPLTTAGYGVILAEFRGYSGNAGSPSEAGLAVDARAYYDWAAHHGDAPLPILLGESIGTGVAVELAADHPTMGLFLDSPFSSIPDILHAGPFFWAPIFLLKNRFDSLSRIHLVTSPVFVLHGTADTIIPNNLSRKLLSAMPCPGGSLYRDGLPHLALASDPTDQSASALLKFLKSLQPDGRCSRI